MSALSSIVLILAGCVCAHAGHEGEDFMLEMATEVLSNPEKPLDIPWEIFKDTPTFRDVGYVGEHPIKDSAQTEVKAGSLSTVREQTGHPPNIVIGRTLIKESQLPAQPPPAFRDGGVGGAEIRRLNGMTNPTSDLTVWQWQRLKWAPVKVWAEYWRDRTLGPAKLAIFHSSGDMLYGGCTETAIQYKYDRLVAASGGGRKIVLGAALSPYPVALGWTYDMVGDGKRLDVLTAGGISPGWATTYANCTYGPCTTPPKYTFADSGFIMGPVDMIVDMITDLDTTYTSIDNQMIGEYYYKNPDKVTLDFCGDLSMSLHNFKPDKLPVEVVNNGGVKELQSKVTGSTVCFVHGSGHSFESLKGFAAELKV